MKKESPPGSREPPLLSDNLLIATLQIWIYFIGFLLFILFLIVVF